MVRITQERLDSNVRISKVRMKLEVGVLAAIEDDEETTHEEILAALCEATSVRMRQLAMAQTQALESDTKKCPT